MPRYFFHTQDGGSRPDQDGIELPSAHAAMAEAVIMMGQMLKDAPKHFVDRKRLTLTVTDRGGQDLFVLDLSAVAIPPVVPLKP